MTQNDMNLVWELIWTIGGGLALVMFAVTIGMKHRFATPPGSSGHRDRDGSERQGRESGRDERGHEVIRADGYVDSFAGEIEEAGGGWPPIIKLLFPGILLWYVAYMVYNFIVRY